MLPQLASSHSSSMHRTTSLLLLIIMRTTSFFTCGALQPHHQHGNSCIPAERAALLSFKKGITKDSVNLLASWYGQDCCQWRGIRCHNQTGHVVKLCLRNPNLEIEDYDVCDDATSLFGEISPSLLSLKHLEHMDLSMNCLSGPDNSFPEFLGSIQNLRYLNLSGLPFMDGVPPQIGNLSKLQYLDLDNLYFGPFDISMDSTWLTNLQSLQYLGLGGINLGGIDNWPHMLNMIPSLRVISLSSCSLFSANQLLPHLNLTKLEKLDLSWNQFDHSIASCWFWKATSLKYLVLHDTNLFGQFPGALGNMTSLQVLDLKQESYSYLNETGNLKNLCSLEILDLSGNWIDTDAEVSMPRCASKNLQELYLSGNSLTGTLANLIVDFTRLRVLDLVSNQLVGPIPPWIGELTCLTGLSLGDNQLSGSIPPGIGTLTALTYLDISINNLTGSVPPEIMHLTSLTELNLSSNHLNGTVPTEIGSLGNLIYLDLSNNSFSGVITEEHFAGLKSLKKINLSSNKVKIVVDSDWRPPFRLESARFPSCQMGPLVPALLQWQEITELDISGNALKGELPDWFWSEFSQATYLDISNNETSGSLPADLNGMAFEKLYLTSNQLTGPVPLLPINIIELDISNNTFSGTLPSNLEGPSLEILLMYSNQIVGQIPESLCKLRRLQYLDMSNNIFEGEIPQCFDIQKLQFLVLSNSSLSGQFPAFLQNNTDIEFLDLAWNKFYGRLPTWIGELESLCFLLLSHNALSDIIPAGITNLQYLQCLDLSDNKFSGTIPWHLSNLTFMTKLKGGFMPMFDGSRSINYSYPYLIGAGHLGEILSVTTKGQQLIYGSTIAYFVSIDLSGNSLTGEIPTEIASLVELMNLNLSSNQLSGQIPQMIGAMLSLVSLDLSKNKLSGEIPSNITNLTSLSYLNLSYNNLSGRIPSGRQLDTLNEDNPSLMYIGNSGLCGPRLHKNCSGNDTVIHGYIESSKQEFEPMSFYFGLVLGLLAGLWLVFCALLFKKTWRIAYFRLFDKVYDGIYVFVVVKWASFARKTIAE